MKEKKGRWTKWGWLGVGVEVRALKHAVSWDGFFLFNPRVSEQLRQGFPKSDINQWFSTSGDFVVILLPREHLAKSQGIFGCQN